MKKCYLKCEPKCKPKCEPKKEQRIIICDNVGRDVEQISIEEFLPRISLVASGIPTDVALEYIRQACHNFARRTGVLERFNVIKTEKNVVDYYIENADGEQVALVNGFFKTHLSGLNILLKLDRRNQFDVESIYFQPPDKIQLFNRPVFGNESIVVHFTSMPTMTACKVDRLLFDRYQDVIVNGALANILLMRKYEFADVQLASVYETKFRNEINRVKIEVLRNFSNSESFIKGDYYDL